MPHDARGTPLTEGDVVTVTFTVSAVSAGETACNVTLQAIATAGFDEPYLPTVSCNSRLVTKVDATPRADDDFLADLEAGEPVTEGPTRPA